MPAIADRRDVHDLYYFDDRIHGQQYNDFFVFTFSI